MSLEELSLSFSCHVEAYAGERCPPLYTSNPQPHPPMPEVGGITDPEVISTEELSLTSCSARGSGPYTVPGQHRRDGPEGVGVGDQTLRM